MALLGWCPQDNQEIFSLEELVKVFDYHHMSKSPAVFDIQKLKWMNGEYMKAMDEDKFYEMALPYIKQVITKDLDLKKIAHMAKTRIEVLPDIPYSTVRKTDDTCRGNGNFGSSWKRRKPETY